LGIYYISIEITRKWDEIKAVCYYYKRCQNNRDPVKVYCHYFYLQTSAAYSLVLIFFPLFYFVSPFWVEKNKKKEKIRKSLRTYSRNRIPHLGSDSLLLPGGGSGGFRAQRQQGRNRQQQQEQNNNNNNKKSNLLEEAAAQENTP
jgi:hypothetical protein